MPTEKPIVLPLTGEEVQHAVLYKLAQSFERDCHLSVQNSYTAFRATITVKLVLIDYGREQNDNHEIVEQGGELPAQFNETEHTIEIDAQPPNVVRIETSQPVPVRTVEAGKEVVKHVKYQPPKGKAKNAEKATTV